MQIVSILNKSKHPNPSYSTNGSAGMDLRADIESSISIKPLERVIVSTKIHIGLPNGYEAQIRPRSGMAAKYGITVLNTPGTIDSDYTGEIKVILINFSNEDFIINDGDRIAQMVISNYSKCVWREVKSLDKTERGSGGFGHTGKN